jgi:hypothetical protein
LPCWRGARSGVVALAVVVSPGIAQPSLTRIDGAVRSSRLLNRTMFETIRMDRRTTRRRKPQYAKQTRHAVITDFAGLPNHVQN